MVFSYRNCLRPESASLMNPGIYTMNILFRTFFNYNIFRLLILSKPWHIQNSRHSRYRESFKYSLHQTLCNLCTFITLVYSNSRILRIRGILKTLSNMYDGRFSTEPYVTLAWHNPNSRHQNLVKCLSWTILLTTMCNPSLFKTLAYSESKAHS